MKFLHDDISEIISFAANSGLKVIRITFEINRPVTLTPGTFDDLYGMFEQSKTLWGEDASYYFYLSTNGSLNDYIPINAVRAVETSTEICFLLFAYQDGGVISVSGQVLTFQNDAADASWWLPPRF